MHNAPRNLTALPVVTIRIVNVLVENNADINLRDDVGNTALHVAVGKGNLSLVHYLIDRGADINIPNNAGETPLYWMFKNGWHILVAHFMHTGQTVLPIYMQAIQLFCT
jgi:ankyrin repeat protein